MGRELKKVAMDFNWPIGKIWEGFDNPFRSTECKNCCRTGLNAATKQLRDGWYSFTKEEWVEVDGNRRYNDYAWANHITQNEVDALVTACRLHDFTHDFVVGKGWEPKVPAYIPTAEEVNQWNRTSMGHDSINQWICVKTRAERLGVYGLCEHCQGDGEIWESEETKKMGKDWRKYQPPVGEGFQLWSTTTGGHPMTPVFTTLEALCEHCEAAKVSVFGGNTLSKTEWLRTLSNDDIIMYQTGNVLFI